jgi:hypothetical protein
VFPANAFYALSPHSLLVVRRMTPTGFVSSTKKPCPLSRLFAGVCAIGMVKQVRNSCRPKSAGDTNLVRVVVLGEEPFAHQSDLGDVTTMAVSEKDNTVIWDGLPCDGRISGHATIHGSLATNS